jgi:predicted RNA-binding protein
LQRLSPEIVEKIHVCFYEGPFGVVPIELDEVYPLSQHEAAIPLDEETRDYVTVQVKEYVENTPYSSVVLLNDQQNWGSAIRKHLAKACATKNVSFFHLNLNVKRQKAILTRLENVLRKLQSD